MGYHLVILYDIIFTRVDKWDILVIFLLCNSLIEWFRLNRRDPVAMQYLYTDIPKHYVFRMPKRALEIEARIVELATIAAEETKYGYLHVVSLG